MDGHGDRMKGYEASLDLRLDPFLPIYARIDGRSFSRFTRGMKRPFDPAMSDAMIHTTAGLVEKTHARIAYTQSDEISLVFLAVKPDADVLFGGRALKLTSVLASLATALFTARINADAALRPYSNRLPHFDCRVCQIPTQTEAANMFVWRYKDARKNAISMTAQSVFSHKQLHGKNGGEMLEMLRGDGIEFDTYPRFFMHGTFVRRSVVMRELTVAELSHIPEKHRPSGPVERSGTVTLAFDFLACTNREAFIFDGAEAALANQHGET